MKGPVLVTGAAKRIGRAIALDLARAGYDIALHYHTSQHEAEHLAEEIQALGRSAWLVELDLADTPLVEKLIPALSDEIGPLAALVNSASLFLPDSMDPENRQEKTNLDAPRVLSEAFYRQPRNSAGVIINLLDADPSVPDFAFHNQSKKALAELTLDHAKRFAPGLRVNGVAPGPVLPSARQSPEHFQKMVENTPLGKPIAPEEIAAAVRFLIESPSITGAILPVDGGLHLKSG